MKVRTHAVRLSEALLLDCVWLLGSVASVRVADQWFASLRERPEVAWNVHTADAEQRPSWSGLYCTVVQ